MIKSCAIDSLIQIVPSCANETIGNIEPVSADLIEQYS